MGDMIIRNAWLLVFGFAAIAAVAMLLKLGTVTAAAGILAGCVIMWKSEHSGRARDAVLAQPAE